MRKGLIIRSGKLNYLKQERFNYCEIGKLKLLKIKKNELFKTEKIKAYLGYNKLSFKRELHVANKASKKN